MLVLRRGGSWDQGCFVNITSMDLEKKPHVCTRALYLIDTSPRTRDSLLQSASSIEMAANSDKRPYDTEDEANAPLLADPAGAYRA